MIKRIWPYGFKIRKKKRSDAAAVASNAKIEVVAHKRATKQQIEAVQEINKMLDHQLEENGFTLKIFMAAGGRHPKLKQGK